jgi:cytochrome c oxidase assembly protein subunit 15
MALGVADMVTLAPVALQVLHLLGADLFWIALVATCSNLIFSEVPLHAATETVLISSAQHP